MQPDSKEVRRERLFVTARQMLVDRAYDIWPDPDTLNATLDATFDAKADAKDAKVKDAKKPARDRDRVRDEDRRNAWLALRAGLQREFTGGEFVLMFMASARWRTTSVTSNATGKATGATTSHTHATERVAVVYAAETPSKALGLPEIRSLAAVLRQHRVKHVVLISESPFSPGAAKMLRLHDRLTLMSQLNPTGGGGSANSASSAGRGRVKTEIEASRVKTEPMTDVDAVPTVKTDDGAPTVKTEAKDGARSSPPDAIDFSQSSDPKIAALHAPISPPDYMTLFVAPPLTRTELGEANGSRRLEGLRWETRSVDETQIPPYRAAPVPHLYKLATEAETQREERKHNASRFDFTKLRFRDHANVKWFDFLPGSFLAIHDFHADAGESVNHGIVIEDAGGS